MTTWRSSRLARRVAGHVAVLAVAVALVLMHHVVGAHQHAPSTVTTVTTASEGPAPAHGAAHAGGAPAVDGPAAALHVHPDGGGHDHGSMLLHLCLAVLLVAAGAVLLVVVMSWWRTTPRPLAGGTSSRPATRAPPGPPTLARLQVLRL